MSEGKCTDVVKESFAVLDYGYTNPTALFNVVEARPFKCFHLEFQNLTTAHSSLSHTVGRYFTGC